VTGPSVKRVFLSHIAEESARAIQLKRLVERAFGSAVHVFASSEPGDLPPGVTWQDALLDRLRNAEAILVLCSSKVARRPWISFEAGSGWRASVPVIPICHQDLALSKLPSPLSMFQGVALRHASAVDDILRRLSQHLSVPLTDRALHEARLFHLRIRAEDSSDREATALLHEVSVLMKESSEDSGELTQIAQVLEVKTGKYKWGY
jgi:hypothetical protein